MDITRDRASELARQLVGSQFGEDLKTEDGDQIIIQYDQIGDHDNAWSVPFNTETYLNGDPPSTELTPSVVVVPKDGSGYQHFAPTSIPVAEYLQRVRDGTMQWAELPENHVTYFAKIGQGYQRSHPMGIARRRLVRGQVIDEAFTRNLKWEPTEYFWRYQWGHNDIDHVKITEVEADNFIKYITKKLQG